MAINDNTSSDDLLMGILNDPNKSDEDKIKEYTNILAGQQNEETNLSRENQIKNTEKNIASESLSPTIHILEQENINANPINIINSLKLIFFKSLSIFFLE